MLLETIKITIGGKILKLKRKHKKEFVIIVIQNTTVKMKDFAQMNVDTLLQKSKL